MSPSVPTHYSPIFKSGRTGFEYSPGATFDGCEAVLPLMVAPRDGIGRQAGVAFRLRNGSLVLARPGGRTLRLAKAA